MRLLSVGVFYHVLIDVAAGRGLPFRVAPHSQERGRTGEAAVSGS